MKKLSIEERVIRNKARLEIVGEICDKIEYLLKYNHYDEVDEICEWQIEQNKITDEKINIYNSILDDLLD